MPQHRRSVLPTLLLLAQVVAADLSDLLREGFQLSGSGRAAEAEAAFRRALELEPLSADALVQVGMREMQNPQSAGLAFEKFELALSEDAQPQPFSMESSQGVMLAAIIGRQAWEQKDFARSEKYFKKAAASSAAGDCQIMQLATHVSPYPKSEAHANQTISRFHTHIDALLRKDSLRATSVDDDPQLYCMLSAFHHSFYYRSDWRDALGKYHALTIKAFPTLSYTAPHLVPSSSSSSSPSTPHECGSRVRLGVASAFFQDDNSVLSDFRGVLDRLNRDAFEVTIIRLVGEQANSLTPRDGAYTGIEGDALLTFDKRSPSWLDEARRRIGELKLDVLFYPDLTMSGMAQRLAMSRLARIQATSHGHPTTSGLPQSIMQYYISWRAAELPTASEHYTEHLVALPAGTMHQYLAYRAPEGVSTQDGLPYTGLTRDDFSSVAPADGHWYLCMQKPFKRQPEFDAMLKGILKGDPSGRLLLHDLESASARSLYKARLKKAGVDLTRVHLIPVQPHHRLMALYTLAEVTLDSYPASGCTTTREALEVGALVVTLPAKYLGSRWSLAYYSIMGLTTELVAKDREDYVRLAVSLAGDRQKREALQAKVKASVHKIFRQDAAVSAWESALNGIARGTTVGA